MANGDRAMDRKVVFMPYDMDTGLGTNNSGVLMFSPYLEDTDTVSSVISGGTEGGSEAPVYNAQDSVFWCNLRDAFRSERTAMFRNLIADGVWSYKKIEKLYEDHQAKWPEAIFNEDAWTKYIIPLVDPVTVDESTGELIRTDRYLTMLQGSKTEQRKWWLYNRFRYLSSKYVTGEASSNIMSLRVFASGTMSLTPAIDLYVGVSFGGGTTVALQRTAANMAAQFSYVTPSGVTEMETWIYSADLITDVGDLSVFYPNELDFSKATRLKSLKIGDSTEGYSNTNLRTIDVRNSALLERIDCRNCPNLNITVNLEGSPRLSEAYFDNTAITGVDLVDGGALEVLHLPSTITTLTLLNLNKLRDLTVASYSNVTRLMLSNIDQTVANPVTILNSIPANSQVNIQGLYLNLADATAIDSFLDLLDTMRGVTREKSATGEWLYHDYETAQVSGEIHTNALSGSEIEAFRARYPYISFTADHTSCTLRYYNYDGTQLLETQTILDGGDGTYAGTPTRAADAQYTYTFAGWNTQRNQLVADPNATKGVTTNRDVYAAYTGVLNTYTITWKNYDGTVLETDTNVPYGTMPSYDGATPTKDGDASTGWSPEVSAVTGNTIYTATYIPKYTATFIRDEEDGGGTLWSGRFFENTVPVYGGATPTTTQGTSEEFAFAGWIPALTAITQDTTYTAKFSDLRSMTVKFLARTMTEYEG